MGYSTYSFSDVSQTISHPSLGQYVLNGEGVGSISVAMANDNTVHDVSADGSVMSSKIKVKNGTLQISVQQTAELNTWLLKAYNYAYTAPVNEWARFQIIIRAPLMKHSVTATGVSFQKIADRSYQSQGQQVTWTLMAADIQQEAI
ncbi:phage protein [Paenibacillus filicis]|uniref:Phage protein n=1 Tax=Paenibacillus filicis TaxID=669464 RepID=A0ABU9DIF6_9BACL